MQAKSKSNPEKSSKIIRWWDPLTAFLLIAALITAATRLVATKWVQNLNLVQTVVFLAAIAGLALGQSIFSKRVVFFFALAYGIFGVPWQLGLTYDPTIAWYERLVSMSGRIQLILRELVLRDPITDNIFFLFLMAILFWLLGVYSGYQLTRHGNAWHAVLPAGLVSFVIHSFDPLLVRRSWFLAAYLFLGLLIIARMTYIHKRVTWRQERVHVPPDLGFDLSRITLLVAVAVVIFAWSTPVLADPLGPARDLWTMANQPWIKLKDRFSYAFASLRASVGLVSDYYGDEHYLGRGNVLSDSVVMHVEAPRSPFSGVRYYWQARSYDEYMSDGRWKTTVTDQKEITPDSEDLALPSSDKQIELLFTFKPLIGISALYAVPQPVWFSRPVNVRYAPNSDGSIDPVAYDVRSIIRPGEEYQVRSSINSVTQADLRQAGTEYPDWIKSRYLQLPDAITTRTRLLAISIAQGLNNPYDIAEAVTQYLRDNIEYSEVIDAPPQGQEPIDWFLFDYKKGFCNYYSSAEIILLRSLGIPARWAVGYAQGERAPGLAENLPPQLEEQLPTNVEVALSDYTVRQRDSHAWPEVYFPGIGWVEFEPTVSQNPLVRPTGENSSSSTDNNQQDILSGRNDIPAQPEEFPGDSFASNAIAALEREQRAQRIRTTIIVIVVVLALIGIGYLVFTRRKRRPADSSPLPVQLERSLTRIGVHPPNFLQRWASYSLLPILTKAYLEINRALVRLGNAPAVEDTPSERATNLIRLLPEVKITTERLLQQYQIAQYSDHRPDPDIAYDARAEIRTQARIARIRAFFDGLPGLMKRQRSVR